MGGSKSNFRIVMLVGVLMTSITFHAAAQQTIYVQVKEAKLRSSPAAWSPSVTTLSYGTALQVVGGSDPWWQVKTSKGSSGFIAASSVSDRKIVLSSVNYKGSVAADPSDVVLAGKGFSKDVEKSFAARTGLDFKKVDQVERIKTSEADLRAFVKAGDLKGGK